MKTADNERIRELHLSPRLEKIAELIPSAESLADIGTDHAYIPICACLSNKVKHAVASDIKLGPIARAADNIKHFDLGNRIILRIGPGLQTIAPGEADIIVIAGMGGILISEILKTANEVTSSAKLLILQPMTAATELRDYLAENEFTCLNEHIAAEEDKFYNIIPVIPGGKTSYTPSERILGKGVQETSAQYFEAYRKRLVQKFEKRINGLKASKLPENITKAAEVEEQVRLI